MPRKNAVSVGDFTFFRPGACPARGQKCNNCGKTGHFAVNCQKKTSRAVNQIEDGNHSDADFSNAGAIEDAAVSSLPRAKMRLQGHSITILIDSGTGANLISTHYLDMT